MSSAVDTKEREFALAIRRALEENLSELPQPTLERLALARRAAMLRKKPAAAPGFVLVPALAGASGTAGFGSGPAPRRRSRFALLWPVLALIASLSAIAYWEDQQRLSETADIDAAMLSDELPLNAYLDHGFNAYLSHSR
jgi:hypothetical protein